MVKKLKLFAIIVFGTGALCVLMGLGLHGVNLCHGFKTNWFDLWESVAFGWMVSLIFAAIFFAADQHKVGS